MLSKTELDEVYYIKLNKEEKLSFFITGLSFATLGAAIQTANSYSSCLPKICELCGWLILFVAGLLGIIGIRATIDWWNKRIDSSNATPKNAKAKGEITKRARVKAEKLYIWRDALLVFGIFILAVGRAYYKITIWF